MRENLRARQPHGTRVRTPRKFLGRPLATACSEASFHPEKISPITGIVPSKMYRLLGSKSQLSIESKSLLYKAILQPIWTYGVRLWSTAANSNMEIIQRFQDKYLGIIVNAP